MGWACGRSQRAQWVMGRYLRGMWGASGPPAGASGLGERGAVAGFNRGELGEFRCELGAAVFDAGEGRAALCGGHGGLLGSLGGLGVGVGHGVLCGGRCGPPWVFRRREGGCRSGRPRRRGLPLP